MVEYLSYFIDLIKRLNFKIKVLCLDRGFYSIDVFEFLQNNKIPHIVPVIKRGEQMKQLLNGNKARSEQYVMKNSKKKVTIQGIFSGAPLSAARIASKTCNPFFLIVEIYVLILQKASAPCMVLKVPDIFCCNFIILMSLSA